jgi:glycosyltransferase involved in cell wall biosynthesis
VSERPLKVLHLFSNSKWTGPAEPVVNACRALRDLGVDVTFACSPKAGSGFNKVKVMAENYQIPCLDFMYLSKHREPLKNLWDKMALARHLARNSYDLIHCHLNNDHLIASRAAYNRKIPLLRSSYEGVGFPPQKRYRRLLRHTSLLIEPSQTALDNDQRNHDFPKDQALVIPGAIDIARFTKEATLPDMREHWGMTEKEFIFGIVARMQTHRHYEDLFTAFHKLLQKHPHARLVVVGRGTYQKKVAYEPVTRLNMEKEVLFTGYLEKEAYPAALAAMDAAIYLTPGSDGTCRAVRELMAMAVPVISSDRGMLPELTGHDQRGLVTDGSPEALCEAMTLLIEESARRLRYSAAAESYARRVFNLEHYGQTLLDAYKRVLNR